MDAICRSNNQPLEKSRGWGVHGPKQAQFPVSLRIPASLRLPAFPGQAAPGKAKLHCVQIVVGLFPVWPGNEGMEKGVGRCPEPHLAMHLDTSVSEQLRSLLDS